jgi:hypothetical protein
MTKKRRMRLGRTCSTDGAKRNAYRILVGKPEGKRLLGRPRYKGEKKIKMDFKEIEWCGANSGDLTQDKDQWRALVNTAINLCVP